MDSRTQEDYALPREKGVVMKNLILSLALIFVCGCGVVKASGMARATNIPVDRSGYTCFLILDDEGKAVGGSCVKE